MKEISTALIACALACAVHSPAAEGSTEKVLLSFNGTDGQDPYAGLLNVRGTLYGTTLAGGAENNGTVFSFNPRTGVEALLFSFQDDGTDPYAGLIDVKGTLYGTTYGGGSESNGTVYSLDSKDDGETLLYSFQNDGHPYAGLLNVKGTLYGTTYGGGTKSNGTVFSFDPKTGGETLLYSFGSGTGGANPTAGLVDVKGTLYGTTSEGGAYGYGTVFSFNARTGATVLHSFGRGTDGKNPYAGLIDVEGTLYGTTYGGGKYGEGTVFSVNEKTSAESVLYSFGRSNTDGENPYAGLLDVEGTLYGTTYGGGNYGYGTVFSLNPETDAEMVPHSFGSGTDGRNPTADLIDVKGTLYGTTGGGGSHGDGTVFSIVP